MPSDRATASLSALMHARVRAAGHQPFLTFYDDVTGERTELGHATFDNWVAKTANLLVEELGVSRGDPVALALGSHWTAAVVAFACWRVGAAAVPVDGVGATGAPVAFVAEAASGTGVGRPGQRVVVVGGGLGARLTGPAPAGALAYGEEVLAFADDHDDPEVSLDDPALVGGTGGWRLSQRNVLAAGEALAAWGLSDGDRLLVTRPALSVDGLVLGLAGAYVAGASVVLVGRPDPAALWHRVAGERVTALLTDAAGLAALPPPPGDGGSGDHGVTAILCPTGAPRDLQEQVGARTGVRITVGHGVERAACASTLTPRDADAGTWGWVDRYAAPTVGVATSRAEVAVLDPGGRPRDAGERGEVAVRGDVVTPDVPADAGGWLRTGDEGFVEVGPDGREWVFLTGAV